MPFGFSVHLRNKNISASTISGYCDVINQFFSYLDFTYKNKLELHEITVRHINQFLRSKEKSCSVHTLNKILTILKRFFDYLWEKELIVIDPTTKIKSYRREIVEIPFSYEQLLDLKYKILSSDQYNLRMKVVYLFALQGATYTELHFFKDDVTINDEHISINVKGKNGISRTIDLYDKDADIFHAFYTQSLFHTTPYVFISKKRNSNEEYGMMDYDVLKDSLRFIREGEEGIDSLNLTTARNAYIFHLRYTKKLSIDRISHLLGINKTQAAVFVENQSYSLQQGKKQKTS